MGKAVVSESALRELLREALDNVGAMGLDAGAPVTPSAVVDRTSMELDFDPIEIKTLPRTKNELIVMVRNILDGVDDDQSGELYKKIKALVSGDEAGTKDFGRAKNLPPGTNPVDRSTTTMKKESKNLVEAIRNIVEAELAEALPFSFGAGKMPGDEEETVDAVESPVAAAASPDAPAEDEEEFDDAAFIADMRKILDTSVWDDKPMTSEPEESEDDEDDEDEAPAAPVKGSPKKRVDLGTGYGVDGDTFEKISKKLGFTPEAAKKAVATAMERFKVLHNMDKDDLEDMVLTGVDEYVDMLAKTGEMTDEEESFMRQHPEHIAASDTFREFFSKYVKRAVRDARADSQDDE